MTAFLSPEFDDQKLLAQVVDYYHRALQESPQALEYLHRRGIQHSEVIERFRVGFSDRTLGKKLPQKLLKAGKQIRSRLQGLGVLRDTGHEQFRGSLTFPIPAADGSGRIVGIYGRKVGLNLRPGTPSHTHLGEPPRGVWNVEAFRATSEIVLCRSLFDALTFWSHGYRNVTAMFGPDHEEAFREFDITRVISAVGDETVTTRLRELGIEVFEVSLPIGLDVNEYALQSESPVDALGALLRNANWLGKGEPARPPEVDAARVVEALLDDEDDEEEEVPDLLEEPDEPEDAPVQTASPLPPAPTEIPVEVKPEEVVLTLGDRRYRVRGLSRNLSYDQMRVNILASNSTGMFVDTFDLYSARHRSTFIHQASEELSLQEQTIKKDLGRVLLQLEELQDEQIAALMEPKESVVELSDEDREAALAFLREPNLLGRIVDDFEVVGERTNKLVGYLAAVSRKLDEPLAVIIQSSSAAGKTSLMEAVLAFVPPEDRVKYSTMTGQSLYYMGEQGLQHKILAIVEEEGAERASYALKLLQSEGELTIASTGKDPSTGRLVTQEYRVDGPVMIFLTTTAIRIDEELLNRCLVLTVDEDREQTRAIHEIQRRRETLEGLLVRQDRRATVALHQNAQRLLRPMLVANPYAEHLTFLDDKTRTRRDHVKYLTLIRVIALLHQYQRPVKTVTHRGRRVEYIEVTLDDIEVANEIAHEVLGRSLDELPPQTRRLLSLVTETAREACEVRAIDLADYRFSRRDVREFTGWGQTQLKIHLKRLEELEYLLVHRGGRGQSFVYELLVGAEGDPRDRVLARLIDVARLRKEYDDERSGSEGELSGSSRGQVAPKSGEVLASDTAATEAPVPSSDAQHAEVVPNAHREDANLDLHNRSED